MEINGSDPVDGQLKADTEIDMSLDDIIQLHKEENDPQDAEAIVQPKNILLYTFGSRDKGFHVQASLQGVSRLRRGLKQGGYNGSQWKTTQISGSGLSPLNRHAFVQKNETPFVEGANNWQEKIPRRRLQPKRTFRLPVVPTGLPKRTVPQTRRPAHLPPYRIQRQPRYPPLNRIQRQPMFLPLHRTQRQSKFNLNRSFLQRASLRSPIEGTKTGRWPSTAISGSVLTVSVPNPKASQVRKAYTPVKRTYTPVKRTKPSGFGPLQSKGVPLCFNFKAVANQTPFTLNERFSTLKATRKYTAVTNGGRTVTLV